MAMMEGIRNMTDVSSAEDNLFLDFGPHEPIHCWKKLQRCEEFVGAPRSKHTMVAWGGRIYVFGGDNGRRMLNDFLVSHTKDSSWARVVFTGSPPAHRYHHSAVVFRDSMFVFGGYTGDIFSNSNLRNKNDLYEYKFTTSQWINWEDKITGAVPPARSAHGAAVYDNRLWIFAGYDGHVRLNDMWTINLDSSLPQWEEIHQDGENPPTCCNFPMAVVDDSMYVFSGQSGANITNNLYEFRFKDRRWLRIRTEHLLRSSASPPQRRYGHTMVAYGRCLYVFGGAVDGVLDNEVHCFDVDSRSWSVIQPIAGSQLPSGRVFHSAAVSDNAMYVFGGTLDSQSNRSGELYRFRFSSFPKCTLIDDFANLLKKQLFCDILFALGPEALVMRAHAAVVAARSPFLRHKILEVYQAHCGGNERESADEVVVLLPFSLKEPLRVELKEVASEAFRMALYFMYTDRVHPELENHSCDGMTVNQMLLMIDVHKLSLLLETRHLELLSMQYIEAAVNVENVLLVLKSASELKLTSLKEYCMKYIVRDRNFRWVIMSAAFESLDKTLMVEIIRRQQFYNSRPTSPDHHMEELVLAPSSLQDDLRAFLLSDIGRPFADVALRVGEDVALAHKAILAARCTYFEGLFRSFMSEKKREVRITFGENVPTRQAFNSFLKFIYCGDVTMPPEDSLFIFSAPNYFGFSNLQLHSYCKVSLESNVSLSNVLEMLEASHGIDLQVMKQHCLRVIADSNNFQKVIVQTKFKELTRQLLLDILEILASKFPSN